MSWRYTKRLAYATELCQIAAMTDDLDDRDTLRVPKPELAPEDVLAGNYAPDTHRKLKQQHDELMAAEARRRQIQEAFQNGHVYYTGYARVPIDLMKRTDRSQSRWRVLLRDYWFQIRHNADWRARFCIYLALAFAVAAFGLSFYRTVLRGQG